MKKRFLICAVVALLSMSGARAQDYNWAIGVRGGVDVRGIQARHNFGPSNALDIMLNFNHGFNVYGLYEWNIPVIADGFNFYYGVGLNMGNGFYYRNLDLGKFTMGINAIAGLEYKIPQAPIVIALDYKPGYNFTGWTGGTAFDFGLSLKFAF